MLMFCFMFLCGMCLYFLLVFLLPKLFLVVVLGIDSCMFVCLCLVGGLVGILL